MLLAGLGFEKVWHHFVYSPFSFKSMDMDTTTTDDDEARILPFQLQFDKPVTSSQVSFLLLLYTVFFFNLFLFINEMMILKIKIAEWNPEKDLLAMVTQDSKILLHRFNWQRLWTISPGISFYLFVSFRI